jgi:hypothetical protein
MPGECHGQGLRPTGQRRVRRAGGGRVKWRAQGKRVGPTGGEPVSAGSGLVGAMPTQGGRVKWRRVQ